MRRAAPGLVCSLALLACASVPLPPPRHPECAGALVPTQQIGADFVARERYRVTRGEREERMDLVVQKRGSELVLVGFDPLGPKLFTIVQRGLETEIESMPRVVVSVPPMNVLRDVHRGRFGAPTDAELAVAGDAVRIRNARCESESVLERVSQRDLP